MYMCLSAGLGVLRPWGNKEQQGWLQDRAKVTEWTGDGVGRSITNHLGRQRGLQPTLKGTLPPLNLRFPSSRLHVWKVEGKEEENTMCQALS